MSAETSKNAVSANQAIKYMLISTFAFALMNVVKKLEAVPPLEIVFFYLTKAIQAGEVAKTSVLNYAGIIYVLIFGFFSLAKDIICKLFWVSF